MSDNAIHDAEREEARDARRFAQIRPGDCYRHHWVSDGAGGGVCTDAATQYRQESYD
jgi:hypothetical protein